MKFTQSHEWIKVNDDVGTVGVTQYAQKELGEIVYVELPEVGAKVSVGAEVAVLESTKAASDIYTPVSGTIIEVNTELDGNTDSINQSPENNGWIFKIKISDQKELNNLLDQKQYEASIK